jgi:hypothetical protein
MNDVIRQFRERELEIDTYFSHLEDLFLKGANITLEDGTIRKVSVELAQILRANSFLLLYNLIESSISQAIEEIHVDIVRNNVEFDTVRSSVKEEIIKFIKKDTQASKFVEEVVSVLTDMLKYYPKSGQIFSGNVDAKKIREIGERYGFSCETNKKDTRDGYCLLAVKDRRNDLAHGFISFQECGKEYTIEEIIRIKKEVVIYIEGILKNIQLYVNNKEYKN